MQIDSMAASIPGKKTQKMGGGDAVDASEQVRLEERQLLHSSPLRSEGAVASGNSTCASGAAQMNAPRASEPNSTLGLLTSFQTPAPARRGDTPPRAPTRQDRAEGAFDMQGLPPIHRVLIPPFPFPGRRL
eukprot:TRINITY_DN15956_c1_g1_i3.p1 TRINITY_DN15956_c1_g1~~TRINITY_DN15956_c1_g1_i3.p1  ORF type:complete len:131 (+),score=16.19 TRINITY_DN15956_c1_g1_i3:83-475(+)